MHTAAVCTQYGIHGIHCYAVEQAMYTVPRVMQVNMYAADDTETMLKMMLKC